MEFTLLESAPFWDVCGVYVLYTQLHHMWRSSEMWQRAGRLSSATWKDICTPADVGFGELEPVSSHSLLVSVLALAYSCGCCLHPLFLLDQDETGWDSALFLLHLPCHIPTLDVGLPISITVSHPAVFFKGWRKYVSHWDTVGREVGSLLCPPVRQPLAGICALWCESPGKDLITPAWSRRLAQMTFLPKSTYNL